VLAFGFLSFIWISYPRSTSNGRTTQPKDNPRGCDSDLILRGLGFDNCFCSITGKSVSIGGGSQSENKLADHKVKRK